MKATDPQPGRVEVLNTFRAPLGVRDGEDIARPHREHRGLEHVVLLEPDLEDVAARRLRRIDRVDHVRASIEDEELAARRLDESYRLEHPGDQMRRQAPDGVE